jgi:hypothetical protein
MIPISLEDQRPFGFPDEISAFTTLDGVVDEIARKLFEDETDVGVGLGGGLELEDKVM